MTNMPSLTAADAGAIARGHVRQDARDTFAEAAFLLFLLLIFIGLQPFATRDPVALAAGESGFGGAGDVLRQVAYLGVFALIAIAAMRADGFRALLCVSPFFAALLTWCALSALWAQAPEVTFRRAVLEITIVMSAMMSVSTLRGERCLALLRAVLGLVLVINWLSIPLVHNAIHLPGEIDPQLVGDWRGLYFHKNIAGSVSAVTAILFFFETLKTRRLSDAALFLAAVGFTVMTKSKSSLGLLPLALAAGCAYGFVWRRGIDRAILLAGLLLVALVGVAIVVADSRLISHALEDPTEFTGRTAIWQAEIAFIHQHFLLGSGFGSFADTGAASPLHNYVADTWVQNISHGHNAYLQLLVTIGAVGFALAMLVFVAAPLGALWRLDAARAKRKSPLVAVFVFMLLHNVLESDFLEGDGPAWVAFLIVLAVLRQYAGADAPRLGRRTFA
jgi:exopolysaccharide production protein ExoQ